MSCGPLAVGCVNLGSWIFVAKKMTGEILPCFRLTILYIHIALKLLCETGTY